MRGVVTVVTPAVRSRLLTFDLGRGMACKRTV